MGCHYILVLTPQIENKSRKNITTSYYVFCVRTAKHFLQRMGKYNVILQPEYCLLNVDSILANCAGRAGQHHLHVTIVPHVLSVVIPLFFHLCCEDIIRIELFKLEVTNQGYKDWRPRCRL